MPAPIMPNANAPIGQDFIRIGKESARVNVIITTGWQRFLASLLANAILPNMLVPYIGVAAPTGWEIDTTVGLPGLPAGYIWIKKA